MIARPRHLVGAVLALTTLGCSSLWAPEVSIESVRTWSCGEWEADVVAHAPFTETLEVDVGTTQRKHTWTVQGDRERFHIEGRAQPGATVPLVARLGGAGSSTVVEVPLETVEVRLSGQLREDRDGVLTLSVENRCGLPLEWSVTGGVQASGVVTDGHTTIPVPRQPHGLLEVQLEVTGEGVVPVRRTEHIVVAGPCTDADHDGYNTCPDEARPIDCNDEDAGVHPGASEKAAPNDIDDNCDGRVDEGTVAYDDDGDGYAEREGDCDDADPERHPAATEVWDCRDQDCDEVVDEGVDPVELVDTWEPNDDRASAVDLGGDLKLVVDVDVVRGAGADPEWFSLYSDDGLFDSWGLGVRATSLPAWGRWSVRVYDGGSLREAGTLKADDDVVWLSGKGGRSDSGTYWIELVPQDVPEGCPATFRVISR